MPPQKPLYDFSKTRRILLLIDLHSLLASPNPSNYISTLTAAASRLLRFSELSATLFSYKFFNLPQGSAPDLVKPFDLPLVTLDSLSTELNSISVGPDLINSLSCPDAACFVQSLTQLADAYSWEESESENSSGKVELFHECYPKKVPSNLVILFTGFTSSIDCFSLTHFDGVGEAFVEKDIHLCWIDVKIDGEMNEAKSESRVNGTIFKGEIEKMGWGYCSSDLIVLGPALLPLGLIYPKIGIPFYLLDFEDSGKRKCHGGLSLEILDVKGMPLECKCCDLEFVRPVRGGSSEKSGQDVIFGWFGNGSMKVHVTDVHTYDGLAETQGTSEIVLVRERVHGSGKCKSVSDFYADRVLEMLCTDMGGFANGGQLPIWEMFLSFLYMKGYWASVSISTNTKDISVGTLKPLSSHLAVLCVSSAGHSPAYAKSTLELPKTSILSSGTCAENMNNLNSCHGSQTETSTSSNCPQNRDGKKKKSQRSLYQDMSWSSFRRAAFGGSNLDLLEVYSSRKFEKSKKLKFFKCWIKQIVKVDSCKLMKLHESKFLQEPANCKGFSSEPSQGQEDAIPSCNGETAEAFFNNISKTIQHGLESGMDLQSLAERIVKSCFRWLNQKPVTENSLEDQQSIGNSSDSCRGAVGTLMKQLLRKCKEMKKIHQNDACAVDASDHCSSPDNIVREYEMQIFLRMEILVSEFSVMIKESRKKKLVKEICSLLEIMQFIVAGGLHGHISLYDYVEQTIKARYSDRLEDVVKQIYSELEMDLLLYDEEVETPSLLFNSEDSNQSWRDNGLERTKIAEANNVNGSFSMDNDSSQPIPNSDESPHGEEHYDILRAKERREKNRRFVSFTRQAPDLQRVWAPKQPKSTKCKFDSLPRKLRKKKRGLGYSVVCETPMTGNKRSDEEQQDTGKSSYTVSKSLFQDS